jgi:hypothetical protein
MGYYYFITLLYRSAMSNASSAFTSREALGAIKPPAGAKRLEREYDIHDFYALRDARHGSNFTLLFTV